MIELERVGAYALVMVAASGAAFALSVAVGHGAFTLLRRLLP